MVEFFQKLFDTSDFPARWYCGNWSAFLGWMHIISDLAIWAAYFGIPISLVYFARKRDDIVLPRIVYLFAAFILLCGSTHLIEAIIFWNPIYRVSALAKVFTAGVSLFTLGVIIKHLPAAMDLPSLAETNRRLQEEMQHRMSTERELLAANARHEALLQGTRSIVWTADPDGSFTRPQVSWRRYTGQAWDELNGRGWINAIHEDDRDELMRKWNRATQSGERYQTTARLWSQDHQAHRRCIAEAVPVRDDEGQIIEWVGTCSDIEDRYQAETSLGLAQQELAEQKRELELIYQSAPVGMSLLDRDLRFLRINDTLARINGLSKEEHIGRRGEEILPGLDDQIRPHYQRVFETGQAVTDVEITGPMDAGDGHRTWLASYYPLKSNADGDAGITAVSAIVQDITERKRQEQELLDSRQLALAANQAKSEFLANMSHEIRTPMAAILGYADVLLGHLEDPDNLNCVIVMKRNGEHLLKLINDILDLSRIEAGKLDVDIEACHLSELVADIQSLMQVRADDKRVRLLVAFEGKVPKTFHTDPTRLRQVLINLIGNAIKFTDEGEVSLKVQFNRDEDPPILEFAIADSGIGISQEQQQKLFKPFSQGDSSVTRQYGGSGLGLAISHRLVQMLSGVIDLQSELGQGSTFYVRLPIRSVEGLELIQPDLDVRDRMLKEPFATPSQLSCRVLVVDDRRDVRHISQHFLEKAGAEVITAEDGQQGIDAVKNAIQQGLPFDLIVMDMQMPVVDGLQATAELRSLGIEWPIIALTADAMKGDRERCLRGGCDDYLSKPIDHARLVAIVAKYTQQVTALELRDRRRTRASQWKRELEGG